MEYEKETPKENREKLKQEELKRDPAANLKDSTHRASNGSLLDLVGSMGWKGTEILIILIIAGFILYSLFFS
ncbi:DUF6366 family protein [Halobacillus halophilus]|uniref:DUF6366 family protein n=1 Tax=Halobacillus halophilus TaxID=1570 RepID=UPI001CD1D45E|nr:DUF6366 family protein [Halobacillus halophilus]MCA1011607.1 DUF6366 family protein [Halobacillus halophilus]